MSTIYISAHKREQAEALAAKLKAAGHEVVSTWHTLASAGRPTPTYLAAEQRFLRNTAEIRSADVFVMVADPDHVRDYTLKNYDAGKFVTGGKFFELGYAVACRDAQYNSAHEFLPERVYVVGGVENGMIGPGVVILAATDEELLEKLK